MRVLDGNHLFEFGEFTLDGDRKVLRRGGEIVSLPLKAVELLCVLIENSGEVVSKNDLIERVWKDSFVEDSVLTQNIYLLRKTLQTNGDKSLIVNVPRRGYLFGGEVRQILSEPSAVADGLILSDGETIIERHLFERIEYSEEEEMRREGEEEKSIHAKSSSSPRLLVCSSLIATAVFLLLIAVGSYFYFRGDSRQTNASTTPIKLKSVASASAIKTLAVLPLRIADEKEKSFAASVSNDLSIRLGSVNKFSVVPLAVVQECQRTNAELKADYVLDGEVSAANNLYAGKLHLLDTKTNTDVWTEKFSDADLVRLEDAISNRTAKAILDTLTEQEKETISKRLPTNLAAYENFQMGYALWRTREEGQRIAYFKRAIESDASFARAYAALAGAEAMSGTLDAAEANLKRAFELDDNLADAYAVQGFIRIFHYRDWQGAEASLKNALALDANNTNAHHWLAIYYSIQRRLGEAKTEMNYALELDPTNPTLLGDMGQLYYFAGEKDLAAEHCKRAIALEPNHPFANQYLSRINQPSVSGDKDATLNQIELQAKNNSFTLPYINVDPLYNDVRDEPRFQTILRRINL